MSTENRDVPPFDRPAFDREGHANERTGAPRGPPADPANDGGVRG